MVSDAELAQQARYLYAEAVAGTIKVAAFGLWLFDVQENRVKKGQFQVWCEKNVPEIKWTTIKYYKQFTKSLLETMGMQVNETLPLAAGGQVLLCEPDELPEPCRMLRDKIVETVAGRSVRQLMLEFKQAEDDGNDGLRPKVGRVKGEGGKRKLTEMEKAGQARERVQLLAKDTCANLDAIAAGFMLMDDNALDYFEATLSRHVEAIRAWKRQPRNDRRPELIYARFSQGGN